MDIIGSIQLYADQRMSTTAAIHTAYNYRESNTILLMDASNAFNSINHQTTP